MGQLPGTVLGDAEKHKERKALGDFVSKQTSVVKLSKDKTRVATEITIKALDHSFRCSGMDLERYCDQSGLVGLQENEARYYVDADKLPPEACEFGQTRRVCIINTNTKETRFEYIRPEEDKRVQLLCRSDKGSKGWTMWFPLYDTARLLGSFFQTFAIWNGILRKMHAMTQV